MNRYDYIQEMKEDIIDYIRENKLKPSEIDEQQLYDNLWAEDSVTGNGSGSYTFNAYKAGENIRGAEDVIEELVQEFGIDSKTVAEHLTDYEYWDVSIRCYLLGEAISEALSELDGEEGE